MKSIVLFVILYVTHVHGINKGFGPGEQDYGYETVREGSHMFWWLYHTTANVTDSSERPLILWLVGGPGGSSCGSGNFMVVGPLDEKLNERKDTWVNDFNVLFIDSPVGSGYSYVENSRLLNDNDLEAAQDLVKTIEGFYNKLPKFKTTPLYVFGLGYGAKIGVEFTRLLSNEIKLRKIDSNLKGVSSTGPWISPMDYVLATSTYLYQVSLIDKFGRSVLENQEDHIKESYDNGKYFQSTLEWYAFMNMIYQVTDGIDVGNIINKVPEQTLARSEIFENRVKNLKKYDVSTKDIVELYLLMNGPVKQALNISNDITWLPLSQEVNDNLVEDFMKPATASVESILNDGIEVHISSGNLDAVASTPGQLEWIDKLSWKNEQIYKNATRKPMWVNKTLEGHYKTGGGLSFYWVNVAGQNIILENPAATREFLKLMTGY